MGEERCRRRTRSCGRRRTPAETPSPRSPQRGPPVPGARPGTRARAAAPEVLLTPLALLLTDLAAPSPAGDLVQDRALSSLLGGGIALVCAMPVVHDRAAVRARRALDECRAASGRAERALAEGPVASFPAARQ
ncbi:hypothetical protein ACIQEY_26135 [Streptomyces parvus]|uniref:hypothetical protein n=1 Tax=Streptomyces parvus TaxID=66428 RepID=UPI00381D7457